MQTDEQTASCIDSLEASQRDEPSETGELTTADGPFLKNVFAPMKHFILKPAGGGGPELKLYDAMKSPDRQLIKAGYFVAEGSLVIQQILKLCPTYRIASILSTEAQLRKLAPELAEADAAFTAQVERTTGVPPAASTAALCQ